MKDLEKRIKTIEERNRRVELDKKWETSWTRRISIAVLTYSVVVIYFMAINNEQPFLNATEPVGGFLISTLLLGQIRKIWQK